MITYISEELYQKLSHVPETKADSKYGSSYPQTIEDYKAEDEA